MRATPATPPLWVPVGQRARSPGARVSKWGRWRRIARNASAAGGQGRVGGCALAPTFAPAVGRKAPTQGGPGRDGGSPWTHQPCRGCPGADGSGTEPYTQRSRTGRSGRVGGRPDTCLQSLDLHPHPRRTRGLEGHRQKGRQTGGREPKQGVTRRHGVRFWLTLPRLSFRDLLDRSTAFLHWLVDAPHALFHLPEGVVHPLPCRSEPHEPGTSTAPWEEGRGTGEGRRERDTPSSGSDQDLPRDPDGRRGPRHKSISHRGCSRTKYSR